MTTQEQINQEISEVTPIRLFIATREWKSKSINGGTYYRIRIHEVTRQTECVEETVDVYPCLQLVGESRRLCTANDAGFLGEAWNALLDMREEIKAEAIKNDIWGYDKCDWRKAKNEMRIIIETIE